MLYATPRAAFLAYLRDGAPDSPADDDAPPDPADVIATALERAAFGAPGPDGGLSPQALADVEAILAQIGGAPPAGEG